MLFTGVADADAQAMEVGVIAQFADDIFQTVVAAVTSA